jgi:P4 family phage/plasmid primase-like protien
MSSSEPSGPVAIPAQLREWRFILLIPYKKIPLAEMKGWPKDRENKTFAYDDSRLQDHIARGGNYGVVTDTDRFVVAADTKEVEAAIEKNLPKTTSVQSPRHKVKHFYFYGKINRPILCKPTKDGDPCADIKTGNAYVLGPGDTFETYGQYRIIDNEPIATITEEQLIAAIDEFILPQKKTMFLNATVEKHDKALDFPITTILPNLEALTQNGNELFGPHPLHGSTTGANFHVNMEKNVWHCFRAGHDSGGGSLELFAVMNGLIKCEDCHKGALRGELFKNTVLLAREKGLVTITPMQFDEGKDDEYDDKKMRMIVDRLQSEFTFKTPSDIEKIYFFNEGVYEEAEITIKELVEKWLGTKISSGFIEEVLGHIRRSSYVKRSEFNKASAIIPVKNGLLDLDTDTLSPFDKDKIFTFKSDAIYDKTKKSTKFLKAVNEWVDPQDIPLLQEIAGYCLLPGMPFHHLFFLHGIGFNGKGSFIRTLQAILGKDHCSNLSLEEFDGNHRFAMARLYGKMMNVSSEPRTDKDLQTSLLKKVCGEDYIDAEEKNKQKTLNFMNTAKPFILGNKFPKVNDNTMAFWERAITLKFPSSFVGAKQIPTIWNTWINDPDEMSGILNWMIEGLHRPIKNNGFTKTKSSEETKIEFQKLSDTTGAFLNERCEHFKEGVYIKRDLYETYKGYCDDEGLDCDQLPRFSTKINSQTWIKSGRIRVEKKLEHVWIGLKVKALSEEQQKLDTTVPPVPPVPPSILSVTFENKEEGIGKKIQKGGTPGTGGTPAPGASLLEGNGQSIEYKQQNQTAYVRHVKTGEPCYNNCGLASEWQVKIEPNFQQFFCNSCFDKAKKDFEKSGFKVEFKEAGQP